MLGTSIYTNGVPRPYINVSGIDAADVIVVDRNGIGVKHVNYFSGSDTTNLITYEYYGVKTETPTATNDLKVLSSYVSGSDRQIIMRVGSTPIAGFVYSVYHDSIIAHYVVQTGDTAEDVRDAVINEIDATSWGTTVVCTPIGTDRIQIDITGTTVDLFTKIGSQIFKKGYYVILSTVSYIIEEKTDLFAFPTLSTAPTSLAYSLLVPLSTSVETYLTDALSTYTYTESVTGTVNVTAVPSAENVPFNECVIDEAAQKVWFTEDLSFGEIIKLLYKT
jgi:hypothetical protein